MRGVKKGFVRGPMSASHKAKIAKALLGRSRPIGAGTPANTPEVLWSKVEKHGPDECWPWIGGRNEQGYGRTEIKDRSYYAHRLIYLLVYPGSIKRSAPKKKTSRGFLRHTCDNPPCCNPAHLIVGTHQENMDDKVARGRMPDYRGERGPRAKLTAEDVFWIRMQKKYGATKKALAMLYEVSEATISGACYGRHYQDVS